jgi:outer membrane receptor protein involved in Fe transport
MLGSTREQTQVVNRTLLASTISALLAGGGAAQAQQQQPQNQQGLEEITVTGSRIVRRDLEAASPIVTIDAAKFENTSTLAIESVLNQLPQFVPAGTQFTQGIQSTPTLSLGIGGINLRGIGPNRTLVLIDGRRAQPANAALLIDANTIPSGAIERVETITGGASAVYGADAMAGVVNFILKKDFEGVDIDMQTGLTEKHDGQETSFKTLMGVNSADGKSNVMLGVEWYNRGTVLLRDRNYYVKGLYDAKSDAPGFIQMAGFSPSTTANYPSQAAIDQVFGARAGYVPGSAVASATTPREIYFNLDGSPFQIIGANGYNSGFGSTDTGYGFSGMRLQPGTGNLGQVNYVGQAQSPLERRSLFGRATHELNDRLTAFAQTTYSSVTSTTTGGYPPAITVWAAPIPNDHARPLPAALQTLLDSRPNPTAPWTLFRVLDFLPNGGTVISDTTSNVYQIMAGVDGTFSHRDWTWEAYVSSGNTDQSNFFSNLPSLQRWQYLVAQPNWGKGSFSLGRNYTITCTSGLPIFGPAFGGTPVSQDCVTGIDTKERTAIDIGQEVAEFDLQGKALDLKNGEMRFAIGASTRKNSYSFEPGESNNVVSTVENPIGIFASNETSGKTQVDELYGELLLPITKRFDMEFGLRESSYEHSSIGKTQTSKTLFTFKATEALSLRGGYQRAERAPNTAELFQGKQLQVVNFAGEDPCSYYTQNKWGNVGANSPWGLAPNPNQAKVQQLCLDIINNSDTIAANDNPAVYTVGGSANTFARQGQPYFPLEIEIRGGNTAVKPERGETFTFGLVLQHPGKLDHLTASFDFYDIKITDAIAPLNSFFAYAQCFNANGGSNPTYTYNNPFCKLIKRNVTTGDRASVDASFLNTGVLHTTGMDMAVNWTKDVGKGSFYINSLVTLLSRYDIQDAPTSDPIHVRDTFDQGGQFKYKLTNTFGYNFGGGKTSLGLQWRYLPGIKDETASRNPATTTLPVGSYQIFNVFANYTVNERMNLRMGLDNLTNQQPLVYGATPTDGNAEQTRPDFYDILGRRAYVGVKWAF